MLDGAPYSVDRLEPLERSVEHFECRHVVEVDGRARPAFDCTELVEHAVLRHLEEPRRELRPQREAWQSLVHAQEDLLREVLREGPVAHQPENVVEHRHLICAHDDREGAFITPLRLPQDAKIRLGQRQGTR